MLNREPMGMKLDMHKRDDRTHEVSVLNREPMGMKQAMRISTHRAVLVFQCSTASRWG